MPYVNDDVTRSTDFWSVVCDASRFLWREWPMKMKPQLLDARAWDFSLSGICPHCRHEAVFTKVGGIDCVATRDSETEGPPSIWRVAAVMKCAGCREHILGIVEVLHNASRAFSALL